MKKIGLLLLLSATAAWAQSTPTASDSTTPEGTIATSVSFPIQRVLKPTYADVYCAGFINRQTLPDANYVAGGLETPQTTKFANGEMIYLRGSGYSAGAQDEIIRALRNVNGYEKFPRQRKLLKGTRQPYQVVCRGRRDDTRSQNDVGPEEKLS